MSKKKGIISNLIGLTGVNVEKTSDPLPDVTVDQPCMVYSNEKDKARLMQEHVHLQVGKVMDATETFADQHVRDKGEKLHDNSMRTKLCAKYLRKFTRARHAKTEAFSIMLQKVATIEDFISAFQAESIKQFSGTKKHLDGPNDFQHKYRHTFVLSTLILKDGVVYRLTIILYSRQSVGRFLSQFGPVSTFVDFMKSYKMEYNGDIHYEDQYYKDNGAYFVTRNKEGSIVSYDNELKGIVTDKKTTNTSLTQYRIVPNLDIYKEGHTHFKFRNDFQLPTFWQLKKETVERDAVHVKWHRLINEVTIKCGLQYNFEGKKLYEGVDVMLIPENCRRYNHPATYAHAINILKEKHPELSLTQKKHLCLIGLVYHSSITFYCLIRHISLAEKNLVSTNILRLFFEYQTKFGLAKLGGIQPRMTINAIPDYVKDFGNQKTLKALDTIIKNLEEGEYYNQETKRRHHKKYDNDIDALPNIGRICALSLPCLLLFTGIVTSQVAVLTAIQTSPKMDGGSTSLSKSHVKTFNQKLLQSKIVTLDEQIETSDAMLDIWDQALPELDRTNHSDCEQTMCADFRILKKNDFIIRFMCTYNLNAIKKEVVVNPYGKYDQFQQLVFANSDPSNDCPHIQNNPSVNLRLSWQLPSKSD